MENEINEIKKFLSNTQVKKYIIEQIKISMRNLGHTQEFIQDLIQFFETLDVKNFQKKHHNALQKNHTIKFLQQMVPIYFNSEVIPQIPPSKKILDIGCGTGILAHLLAKAEHIEKIEAIEIDPYPEWKQFSNKKITFKIVKPSEFKTFLTQTDADSIVMTWVLHHMPYENQEDYMRAMYNAFDNITITILEDTYSTQKTPKYDTGANSSFIALSGKERKMAMAVNDWLANRVFLERDVVPVPFAYRTIEEWTEFFKRIGFKIKTVKYLGFPTNRDVNNPQAVMVIYK